MRTGIFLPNWIGDVVMATPALRSLRKAADAAGDELVGIMKPYVADVIAGLDWFDDSIFVGKATTQSQLRDAELDRIVLLTNSFSTALTAWKSGAKERIGFAQDFRSPLLTTKLYQPRQGRRPVAVPPIDGYQQVAYAAGGEWEPPTLQLATTEADEQAADQVWNQLGLPCGDQVVVFNSGGAYGAAKSWPIEHFAALAERVAADGYHVLVNCGPAERDIAREITERCSSDQVKSLADFPSAHEWSVPIGLSKAVIRRSRMLVSTDSGPRYFGIAFGKPVVSLFGPMGPRATRTHYAEETTLSLKLDCQPCEKAVCPLGHHKCMRDLSVEMVYRTVNAKLQRTSEIQKVA